MHTRPATAPEAAPSTLGLPRVIHSMPAQASAPAAAAKCVAAKALAAMPSDAKLAAGVEAEPADPQHGRAEHGVGQVVRRHRLVPKPSRLPMQQGTDQRRHARADMHDRAAGKVERACQPMTGPFIAGRDEAKMPPSQTQWHSGQ